MEKLEFQTKIAAPREKVWDILWGSTTYPVWTAAFSEGSRAESDWKKGSKAHFLNAQDEGMVADIVESIPHEQMSFRHVGMVNKGVVDYDSPETKAWAGAMEEYWLKPVDGQTELTVRMDMTDEYRDYFTEAWPKAMDAIKTLSEK